jgi:hypothetical protein
MRDEIKAAIVCSVLISAFVAVIASYHPVSWQLKPIPIDRGNPIELLPPAQFDQFLATYGPPTFEEQSSQGVLHPPLFTKWLDYEPEHLRVAFVAAEAPETASGRRWVLISFVDARKVAPVSPEEAARRLASRRK